MSSSNASCGYPPSAANLAWTLNFVVYNIAAPLYFVLAVSGHGLLLFAFAKQLKSQRTYMYQVYCASARTVETLVRSAYFIAIQVSVFGSGMRFYAFQDALLRCYTCVWFSVHLATPLSSSCAALSLFMSVAMAADRVMSLLRPVAYKNMRHDRNRRITLVVCILIAFGTSAFDCWRVNMGPADGQGRYVPSINVAYLNQYFVQVLGMLRVAIQAAALVALASLSAVLCYLYRTRFVNAKVKMTSNTAERSRSKEKERTLVLLTFVECSIMIVIMGVQMVYFTFAYGYPEFYNCWRNAMTISADMCRMILDVSHFYIIVGMSEKFRRMIKRAVLSCLGKSELSVTNRVGPITGTQALEMVTVRSS